jgi:hypothetical protein
MRRGRFEEFLSGYILENDDAGFDLDGSGEFTNELNGNALVSLAGCKICLVERPKAFTGCC